MKPSPATAGQSARGGQRTGSSRTSGSRQMTPPPKRMRGQREGIGRGDQIARRHRAAPAPRQHETTRDADPQPLVHGHCSRPANRPDQCGAARADINYVAGSHGDAIRPIRCGCLNCAGGASGVGCRSSILRTRPTSPSAIELHRARPHGAQPRDGAQAGCGARSFAAAAERAAAGGGVCAGLARERARVRRNSPPSTRRSISCWRNRSPIAAFVVDRRWNLLRANNGGQNLVAFLTDTRRRRRTRRNRSISPTPSWPPIALRPLIVNWREVALYFLRGVRADALADGTRRRPRCSSGCSPIPMSRASRTPDRGHARAGAVHPFRQGRDIASDAHHARHAGHAAGRHRAGDPHRVLLSCRCQGRRNFKSWATNDRP